MDIKTLISYLNILELPLDEQIDAEDLKTQYKKMSKIYHPDLANARYKNGERFKFLTQAFEYIRDNLSYVNLMIQNDFEDQSKSFYEDFFFRKQQEEYQRAEEERREEERRKAEEDRKEQERREAEEKRKAEEARRQAERKYWEDRRRKEEKARQEALRKEAEERRKAEEKKRQEEIKRQKKKEEEERKKRAEELNKKRDDTRNIIFELRTEYPEANYSKERFVKINNLFDEALTTIECFNDINLFDNYIVYLKKELKKVKSKRWFKKLRNSLIGIACGLLIAGGLATGSYFIADEFLHSYVYLINPDTNEIYQILKIKNGDYIDLCDESYTPIKQGYTFVGWADAFDDEVVIRSLNVTENTYLYARFKRNN